MDVKGHLAPMGVHIYKYHFGSLFASERSVLVLTVLASVLQFLNLSQFPQKL